MNTYKTLEVAKIIGVHHNTVRLYEKLGLIPKADRLANGYRIFTDLHIEQFKLARIAFKIEILQNGLRKKMTEVVKTSAERNFDKALKLVNEYVEKIHYEQGNANEAIEITKQTLLNRDNVEKEIIMKRKEVSEFLDISMDTLRNWEMNGLLSVKRKENGYRSYTEDDIRKIKVIRALRCANYSIESILRMLSKLNYDPQINIGEVLDTPSEGEDVISACDKLLTSLNDAEVNAKQIIEILENMKRKFNPTL